MEVKVVNSAAFMWENLPTVVYKRVFSYLDRRSKKNVRRVCSIWKEEMDTEAGLSVNIDTRISGNLHFAEGVRINQARIDYLKDLEMNILLDPSSLRTVFITGIMCPNWFTTQLVKCRNISRLVLCGRFLHSQNLQMHSTVFLKFRSLKTLEIIANAMSYPEPMSITVRRRNPAQAAAYEEYCIEISLTVAKNVSYLLAYIRAPKLKTLHIYVKQKRGWTVPAGINWRHQPLESFLAIHRNSLRELLLPEFDGKYCLMHEENRLYPEKINTLNIMVSHCMGIFEESRVQNYEYWKQFLINQTQLQNLKIHMAYFPNENAFYNPVMEAIGTNCSAFLTNVSIVIESVIEFVIDGAMFQFCDYLKILKINSKQREVTFINFSMLPTSLKKLCIEKSLILNPDPTTLSEFSQLEMLQLETLCLDPGLHVLSLDVVKQFLNLRSLCYVGITFNENAGNNETFQRILDHFRYFSDPRFSYSMGLRINFEYEVEEGWDENIFDDEMNGRQVVSYIPPGISGFSFDIRHRLGHPMMESNISISLDSSSDSSDGNNIMHIPTHIITDVSDSSTTVNETSNQSFITNSTFITGDIDDEDDDNIF